MIIVNTFSQVRCQFPIEVRHCRSSQLQSYNAHIDDALEDILERRRQHSSILATAPIVITAPVTFGIYPTMPLGSAFARGWMNLPYELQCKVLVCNLTFDSTIWRIKPRPSLKSASEVEIYATLREHLRMGLTIG
jgi:hypothetical protein